LVELYEKRVKAIISRETIPLQAAVLITSGLFLR
jgi:hypothetical protein